MMSDDGYVRTKPEGDTTALLQIRSIDDLRKTREEGRHNSREFPELLHSLPFVCNVETPKDTCGPYMA